MRIMGMVSHTHDTGVALINDGRLEMVLEEERLNRDKKTKRFPAMSLDAAITERGLSIEDVDLITMPWHIPTFLRTLTWAIARKFPASTNIVHMKAHPPQQNQLFRGTRYLRKLLAEHFQTDKLPPIRGTGHHHSHAAAFFISPFDDATVLVMDGYGDDASTSAYTHDFAFIPIGLESQMLRHHRVQDAERVEDIGAPLSFQSVGGACNTFKSTIRLFATAVREKASTFRYSTNCKSLSDWTKWASILSKAVIP